MLHYFMVVAGFGRYCSSGEVWDLMRKVEGYPLPVGGARVAVAFAVLRGSVSVHWCVCGLLGRVGQSGVVVPYHQHPW